MFALEYNLIIAFVGEQVEIMSPGKVEQVSD